VSILKDKKFKRALILVAIGVIGYFFQPVAYFCYFYLISGFLDVIRNGKAINLNLLETYFVGHGTSTWLFSPLNLLTDLLALPYISHGRLNYDKLPARYKAEVDKVLNAMRDNNLPERLAPHMSHAPKEMVVWKWYAKNHYEAPVEVPEFHDDYKYIKSISISIFNKKARTGRHFGPFRASYRILFNIKPLKSKDVYIETQGHRHYWHENPLLIFDDSMMHESVNNSDESRYCGFIDMSKPSMFPWFNDQILKMISALLGSPKVMAKYSRKWAPIKKKEA
jgi:hypothetical protein